MRIKPDLLNLACIYMLEIKSVFHEEMTYEPLLLLIYMYDTDVVQQLESHHKTSTGFLSCGFAFPHTWHRR